MQRHEKRGLSPSLTQAVPPSPSPQNSQVHPGGTTGFIHTVPPGSLLAVLIHNPTPGASSRVRCRAARSPRRRVAGRTCSRPTTRAVPRLHHERGSGLNQPPPERWKGERNQRRWGGAGAASRWEANVFFCPKGAEPPRSVAL